jgi:hypothetical protein
MVSLEQGHKTDSIHIDRTLGLTQVRLGLKECQRYIK